MWMEFRDGQGDANVGDDVSYRCPAHERGCGSSLLELALHRSGHSSIESVGESAPYIKRFLWLIEASFAGMSTPTLSWPEMSQVQHCTYCTDAGLLSQVGKPPHMDIFTRRPSRTWYHMDNKV